MNIISIVLISLGLAMDALAVSVASGATLKQLSIKQALRIALFFGSFQAIMPVVGWLAGLSLRTYISGIDHWIAFGLLCFIGTKMIFEATTLGSKEKKTNILNIYTLIVLSFSTSIDALAVGLSFSFLKIYIITPAIIIGIITFFLSYIGVYIGRKLGHFFENKLEIVGGLILIGIGITILIEHLS